MATRQGGVYRRQKGELEQVVKPPEEQRFGAHAEHPSQRKTEAPGAAPSKTNTSAAKSSAPVKGKDDADTATNA